jgi:diguanylate cyclase (GGDEF)-like protein/PAS domain S-box-containing protein
VVAQRPSPAPPGDGEGPRLRAVVVLVAVLATLAVGAGAAATALHEAPELPLGTTAAIGLVVLAAGWLHVDFRRGTHVISVDLVEAALAPAILLIPGLRAVGVAAVAVAASELLLRINPLKAAFNITQTAFAAGVGSLAFTLLAPNGALAPMHLVALLVGLGVALACNHVTMVALFTVIEGRSLRVALKGLWTMTPIWESNASATMVLGVLLAVIASLAPAAIPLFPLPLALLHWASRSHADSRADVERSRGLQRATQALARHVEPDEALPQFLEEVRTAFSADLVELVLVDHVGAVTHRSASLGHDDRGLLGADVARALVSRSEPTRITPDDGEPRLGSLLAAAGWRECLAAPVRGGGNAGWLSVYDPGGLAGSEEVNLAVLAALAGEASSAIERGHLVEAMLEEQRRLNYVVSHSSDGVATIGTDGTVREWNRGFEAITGFSRTDVLGSPFPGPLEAVDEDGAPVTLAGWPSAGSELPVELRVRTASGEHRWLTCTYTEVPHTAGGVGVLVLFARDTTDGHELRQTQEALHRSETRFRALVRHSSDLIVVLDEHAVIRDQVPTTRSFGLPPGVGVGSTLAGLVHPDDLPEVQARFAAMVRQSFGVEHLECRLAAADGTWRHVGVTVTNLLRDPAVGAVVLTCRDSADQRWAAALLMGQTEILEAVARDVPLPDVLSRLAKLMEAQAPGGRCSLLVDDGRGGLAAMAGAPLPPAIVSQLAVALPGRPPDEHVAGPPTRSLAVADLSRTPPWCDLPPDQRRGTRALWATQISGPGSREPRGVVVLRFDQPRNPGPRDWHLLHLASHLAHLADERVRAQERLVHQATHDALTGLPNRLVFLDRAAMALARIERSQRGVAVLFVDLDRFKVVNDSLGHDAGDRLLTAMATRLSDVMRSIDTVARFGGDEFTILCDDVEDALEVATLATRIRDAVATPVDLGEHTVSVTASVGIAHTTDGTVDPGTLIDNADTAMYRAKARGGNRTEVFHPTLRNRALRDLATHSALRLAVDRGDFEIHYQPLVSLDTGRVTGVEALVRWEHPELGLVPPLDFIPLAEETGLIVPIGAHVLREACRQTKAWQDRLASPVTTSINLSARQFTDPGLGATVAEAVADSGVDPRSIALEITESVLMENADSIGTTLRELIDLGVRLTIDDFGTGYSSLTYLKRFPVSGLKIDQSFVSGLGQDPNDSAIVSAVVGLAHSLGMEAVAEGVETPAQLERLRALGCDNGQGHWFSRPVPGSSVPLGRVYPG